MGEDSEQPDHSPAKKLGEWADTAGKVIALASTISGIIVGWFVYSTQVVSTWSLMLLTCCAVGAALATVVLTAIGGWLVFNARRWLGGALIGLAIASLALFLFIVTSWPAVVTWTLQDVPYPQTITAGSPLVTIKGQLIPPGFPGDRFYEAELLKKCPQQASFAQRYVVYVSSELSKNRFPRRITAVNEQELAIAGFVFHRESTQGNAWNKVDQCGLEQVTGSIELDVPANMPSNFAVALVLFPLTAERARDLSNLKQYVTIR